MQRRYTLSLLQHIKIAEDHASYLVEKLLKLSHKAKKLQIKQNYKDSDPLTPEMHKIYLEMLAVTEELKPVESWIKANWPEITELYDAVQSAKESYEANQQN